MIMNTTVPQGEQKSPTIGIRATTSGFSHQQIGIRAYGLKWCLIFCSKNESCKNYVLTIPLCRKGKRTITHINGKGGDCWNIANYVAAIVKEDGCHVRVKESCWCSICSPLTLSKKEATMVGCWWQPTTIV
jgi:hypothetical protein